MHKPFFATFARPAFIVSAFVACGGSVTVDTPHSTGGAGGVGTGGSVFSSPPTTTSTWSESTYVTTLRGGSGGSGGSIFSSSTTCPTLTAVANVFPAASRLASLTPSLPASRWPSKRMRPTPRASRMASRDGGQVGGTAATGSSDTAPCCARPRGKVRHGRERNCGDQRLHLLPPGPFPMYTSPRAVCVTERLVGALERPVGGPCASRSCAVSQSWS